MNDAKDYEICPNCDSYDDVDITDIEYDDDGEGLYETRECHLCETAWETTWKLVGTEVLPNEKED